MPVPCVSNFAGAVLVRASIYLSIINIQIRSHFQHHNCYISQRERIYAQAEQGGSVILAPEYPGDVVSELKAAASPVLCFKINISSVTWFFLSDTRTHVHGQVIFSMQESIPVLRPSTSAAAYLPTALSTPSAGFNVMAGTHILARYDFVVARCDLRFDLMFIFTVRFIIQQRGLHHLPHHPRPSSYQDAGSGGTATLPRGREAGLGFLWQHSSPRPLSRRGMFRQKR